MKKIIKKTSKLLIVIGILFMAFGVYPFLNANAEGEPGIQFNQPGGVFISQSGNSIVYKKLIEGVETRIGEIQIKYRSPSDSTVVTLTPIVENNKYIVKFPTFESFNVQEDITDYAAWIDFIPTEGYEVNSNIKFGSTALMLPGSEGETNIRSKAISIKAGSIIQYDDGEEQYVTGIVALEDVSFTPIGSSENESTGEPFSFFPISVKFSGVSESIIADSGIIMVPTDWTSGEIEFFANICTTGEVITPDDGNCLGTTSTIRVDIENTVDDANGSVTFIGQKDNNNMKAIVGDGFASYGRTSFHLVTNDANGKIGQSLAIVTPNYIGVKAISDMDMSFSFGSEMETKTTLSHVNTGSVKIFFGNSSTTLVPEGPNVRKIKTVTGAEEVVYNNDGSATVELPDISEETTTRVTIQFEMNDGTIITKNLDIIRTAITLNYSDAAGKKTLYAGYVANKKYLYNNMNHDESEFDAYLQVILYKDNKVAGYRQVQIDDKDFIDDLNENATNGIESTDMNNAIVLAGDGTDFDISDVNGASVFLTNGPIDFNSDTLPSIEYGIGAGVKVTWEAR